MLDLLKDTQNSPFPLWLNVVPSLEKLCQAVVVRNDQANLQPTLNKGAGGVSLPIFVTDCRSSKGPIDGHCFVPNFTAMTIPSALQSLSTFSDMALQIKPLMNK